MLKKVLIIINISKDASMILAKEIASELKSYGFACDFLVLMVFATIHQ